MFKTKPQGMPASGPVNQKRAAAINYAEKKKAQGMGTVASDPLAKPKSPIFNALMGPKKGP